MEKGNETRISGPPVDLLISVNCNLHVLQSIKLLITSISFAKAGKKQDRIIRFEENKLIEPVIRQQFQLELRNRF